MFIKGWYNILEQPTKLNKNSKANVSFSIIIPARNEEKNISKLLDSILKQNYPKNLYEIIIIDDFSDDQTVKIVNNFSFIHKNIHLIKLQDKNFGKKEALRIGIKKAKNKLIITTDADCYFGKKWLLCIANFYKAEKPKMLVAPVIIKPTKKIFSFSNFQSLEFLSLISSGAGAIGIEYPIMCNGANLIFEKGIYQEFNNAFSAQYVSGDDILFMLKIKKKYPQQIKFLKSRDAVAYTQSQVSIKDFINQRIRWTSKSKAYKDFDIIFTGLTVLLINLLLFTTFFISFYNINFLYIFSLLFILKSIPDFILLFATSNFFKVRKLLLLFLPLQFFYFFYIVIIGIVGNFANFKWKGRRR